LATPAGCQSAAPGAKPRFDTVMKVARALGIRLAVRLGA